MSLGTVGKLTVNIPTPTMPISPLCLSTQPICFLNIIEQLFSSNSHLHLKSKFFFSFFHFFFRKDRTKMKLPLGAFELLHVVKGHVLFPSVKSGQKAN